MLKFTFGSFYIREQICIYIKIHTRVTFAHKNCTSVFVNNSYHIYNIARKLSKYVEFWMLYFLKCPSIENFFFIDTYGKYRTMGIQIEATLKRRRRKKKKNCTTSYVIYLVSDFITERHYFFQFHSIYLQTGQKHRRRQAPLLLNL